MIKARVAERHDPADAWGDLMRTDDDSRAAIDSSDRRVATTHPGIPAWSWKNRPHPVVDRAIDRQQGRQAISRRCNLRRESTAMAPSTWRRIPSREPIRKGTAIKLILLCAALAALPASARGDETIRLDTAVRVGQTLRLRNIAAHHADCSTSDAGSVDVVVPPSLGRIAQQEGVPATVEHSLSGTCLGAHLTGIGVDYTATQAGTDRFEFDGVFGNGRARYIVTARNR